MVEDYTGMMGPYLLGCKYAPCYQLRGGSCLRNISWRWGLAESTVINTSELIINLHPGLVDQSEMDKGLLPSTGAAVRKECTEHLPPQVLEMFHNNM